MWDENRTTRRRRKYHCPTRHPLRRTWASVWMAFSQAGRLPILTALFIFGLLVGRGMIDVLEGGIGHQALLLVGGFVARRSSQSFWESFLMSFFSSAGQLLLLLFLGFCVIGAPFLYLYPFVRGMGVALSYGMLFYQRGVHALGWFLILLPNLLYSTIILLQACQQSIILSVKLIAFTGRKEGPIARICPSTTYKLFLLFILFLVLSSGMDAILSVIFGHFLPS